MCIRDRYKVASDEVNAQCDAISGIIKNYDENGMLIGEAPCTQDLITTTDHDFKVVSAVSIGAIFVIIAVVFKSISLPIILVAAIYFAIFINMGIPAYTGTQLPFIASIVIGTIQLGATVDYAIPVSYTHLDVYKRQVTARSYAIQITNFSYCVGAALAQANAIMVGWRIGAQDYEACDKGTRKAAVVGVIVATILESIFALSSHWLIRMFTDDPQMVSLVGKLLAIEDVYKRQSGPMEWMKRYTN